MGEVIHEFIAARQAAWLKKNVKPAMSEEEINAWTEASNNKFSLAQWLPDAAKRAKQLSMVSHSSKFSHPSANASPIVAAGRAEADGYLRSGNVDYEQDALGNAAALDVYKFLMLKMADGQTVLAHLEQDSEEIQQALQIESEEYATLKQGFLAIKEETDMTYTDCRIRQIYFPIAENSYHLLSLLTPSGLIARLKGNIDTMRFSEETKKAKESRKKNEIHDTGYDDIFELTVMGYGGTKPQNISVLNNQNAGRAYLLSCFPPKIKQRSSKLPRRDFFKEILWIKRFENDVLSLHLLMEQEKNTKSIRDKRDEIITVIVDKIVAYVLNIRAVEPGWSASERYAALPLVQKIWLDSARVEERTQDEEWLNVMSDALADWISIAYKRILKERAIMLSDDEQHFIQQRVQDNIKQIKEFFR